MYVRVMNRSEKIEKLANRPTLGFYESIALHCIALHCIVLELSFFRSCYC
jgi:hypothetical protein